MVKSTEFEMLQCKNLHEFIKTLSPSVIDDLYANPAPCLAIFRELPELSKIFVMRLLFVDTFISKAVVLNWVKDSHKSNCVEAVEALLSVRIFLISENESEYTLNVTFRKNLQVTMLGGGVKWMLSPHPEPDVHHRDVAFLDNYAMERWECLLHYMVGSGEKEGISADAVHVLLTSGLMNAETDGAPIITRKGFQFLLIETHAQVWFFIVQYLISAEERGMNITSCLNFLFQLSFSTLGKDYSTEGMSEELLSLLQHFREFGLIYQRKRKSGRFYPTRLAVNIASGFQMGKIASSERKGYIVVETNYRVYAYTDSHLQVALLGLFTELIYRFPNLTVGVLTRDSVRAALRSGITADQILHFLKSHAHNEMLTLPNTICDQIKLWEMERERFKFNDGVLYNQFLSQNDFNMLKTYAQDLNHLVWSNDQKRTMVVTKSGHDDVKKFWKNSRGSH